SLFPPSTPTARHPLPLHDALPISPCPVPSSSPTLSHLTRPGAHPEVGKHLIPYALGMVSGVLGALLFAAVARAPARPRAEKAARSEEHTSELQSRGHLVCRLLLEK